MVYMIKKENLDKIFLLIFHILVKNNFNNHSSDNINDVLDYVHVIEIIKKFIEAKDSGFKKYFLLEKLIEDLSFYLNRNLRISVLNVFFYLLQKLLKLMKKNKKSLLKKYLIEKNFFIIRLKFR